MSGIMNAGLAWILVTAREYHWCIEQCHIAVAVDPTVTLTHIAFGTAYEQIKMYTEAISSYEKGIALGGAVALNKAFLGHVYGSAGDRENALRILHELDELSQRSYMPSLNRAIIYDGLGETDLGIQALEKAVLDGDVLVLSIKVWPQFDHLRTDPRFRDLEQRLGLQD
jgi:tetratricopeptide (TPR) repeat protein